MAVFYCKNCIVILNNYCVDGPNDLEMMEFADISVAMGNAREEIKKAADIVTSRVDEDGIYRAFERLKLLE